MHFRAIYISITKPQKKDNFTEQETDMTIFCMKLMFPFADKNNNKILWL